jgi:hypothetical protein
VEREELCVREGARLPSRQPHVDRGLMPFRAIFLKPSIMRFRGDGRTRSESVWIWIHAFLQKKTTRYLFDLHKIKNRPGESFKTIY